MAYYKCLLVARADGLIHYSAFMVCCAIIPPALTGCKRGQLWVWWLLATLAIKVHFVCFFGFVVPELVLLSSNSNTLLCWGMLSSNRSRIIITFLVASELLMLAYFRTSAINLKICTLSSTVQKAKSEVEPPNRVQQILASHWFDSPCMCGSWPFEWL